METCEAIDREGGMNDDDSSGYVIVEDGTGRLGSFVQRRSFDHSYSFLAGSPDFATVFTEDAADTLAARFRRDGAGLRVVHLFLHCLRCQTQWFLSPSPCRVTGLTRRMKDAKCPQCASGTREHLLELREK